MTFQLDTTGRVAGDMWAAKPTLDTFWSDLSPFTQGYIEALLTDHRTPKSFGDDCREFPYAFRDLAPETLARIIADCEAWRDEYSDHVRVASGHRPDMGREFWRIRQTSVRSTFPPLTVQLGDDAKVRFAA